MSRTTQKQAIRIAMWIEAKQCKGKPQEPRKLHRSCERDLSEKINYNGFRRIARDCGVQFIGYRGSAAGGHARQSQRKLAEALLLVFDILERNNTLSSHEFTQVRDHRSVLEAIHAPKGETE